MGIALWEEMHRSRSGHLLWDSKAQLSICLSKKLPCHGRNNLGLNTELNLQARTIWQWFKSFCCIVTTFFSLEKLRFSQDSCFSRQQQITGKASQKNKWHKKIQIPDKNKYINTDFPRCKCNKVEKCPCFSLITPYSPLFQAKLDPYFHLGIVYALSATGQMYKQYSGKWKAVRSFKIYCQITY